MTQPIEKTEFIAVEYHDNNRVQVIHINSMTRQAVDEYVSILIRDFANREDALTLAVHDYGNIDGMISPYFLGKLKHLKNDVSRDDLVGRLGIVTSANIFRIMMNPIMKLFKPNTLELEIQFFDNVDEAVEWVSAYQE